MGKSRMILKALSLLSLSYMVKLITLTIVYSVFRKKKGIQLAPSDQRLKCLTLRHTLFCIGYEHDTDWCADLCCSHREVEPTQKAGPQDSNISGLRTQMVSTQNILIIVTDTLTVLILFSAHLLIVIHHDNQPTHFTVLLQETELFVIVDNSTSKRKFFSVALTAQNYMHMYSRIDLTPITAITCWVYDQCMNLYVVLAV